MKPTIGVDLHKCRLNTVVLDENGVVQERRELATKSRRQIAEYFGSYGREAQVAVESVGFSQWFWELVHPRSEPFIWRIRLRFGRLRGARPKRIAKTLCFLLRDERLPMAYGLREPVRALREMACHRHSIAHSLAVERRSLALKNNLPGPDTFTSERAQKWLLSVEPKLSAVHRLAARQRPNHIIALERDVWDVERAITEMAGSDGRLMSQVRLVESVPGIGRISALTIVTETGDITQFKNIDQLSAYAGLAPTVSQSGESVHHGHISKQGPPALRWILQQAAWVAIRTSPEARAIFARISKRAGATKATTVLTRKLLSYCWSVCRKQTPFHWPGEPTPPPTNPGDDYPI
ncbi:hypothetical protein BH09VER1_BH09VER1_53870 [soil metagenome]